MIVFVAAHPGEASPMPASYIWRAMMQTANLEPDSYPIVALFHDITDPEDIPELDAGPYEAALTARLNAQDFNVIVPLGDVALRAFIPNASITQFRGAVSAAQRIASGAKLVPTFDPLTVQRSYKLMSFAIADLIKAADEADRGPAIHYPAIRLLVEPNIREVQEFCNRCEGAELLSVDIECGWGLTTCIGIAIDDTEAMTIPFVDLRKPNKSYWATGEHELAAWAAVRKLLEGPTPKLFQNGAFDVTWLLTHDDIRVRNYKHDTKLLHHALYPELKKDLATMGALYTRLGSWKNWGHGGEEKSDA